MNIYTIGHSNHPIEKFIDLLLSCGIEMLIDVRSTPYSRYAPHFNKTNIERTLKDNGIDYLFMGKELGGIPQENRFYDTEGHVRYDLLSVSETFRKGIEQVMDILELNRTAIMCGEENPIDCHRRLLISRVLSEKNVGVLHIRKNGSIIDEIDLANKESKKKKGQLQLFITDQADNWRSRRPPVLRKKQNGYSKE